MKTLVTGGLGDSGLVVTTYQIERRFDVRVIDNIDPEDFEPDKAANIQNEEY